MRTFEEMLNQLKQLDEITVVELLNISSEELVDRFRDIIENDQDRFENEIQQWFPDEDEDEANSVDQN